MSGSKKKVCYFALGKRADTKRSFDRIFKLEVKLPQTHEVPFKVAGDIIYKKQEQIESNFILENKIYKNFLVTSRILRQIVSGNVIPTYMLESEYKSEMRDDSRQLSLRVEPQGNDIKTSFFLDMKNKYTNQEQVRLVDVQGMFDHNAASGNSVVDYNVDVKYSTFKKTNARLYGKVLATMFKSNIDLKLDFASVYMTLPQPANIKYAHSYDGSKATRSYVELAVSSPYARIDYGLKTLIGLGDGVSAVNSLEFQLKTPTTPSDKPYTVLLGKTKSSQSETELSLMVNNFNIDLSESMSPVAKLLYKVDNSHVLRKVEIVLSRKVSTDGASEIVLDIEKNDADLIRLNMNTLAKVDMLKLLSYASEIPRQEASAAITMQLLEHSGSIKTKLSLEKSDSQAMHVAEFEFKTEDIFKFVTRVDSIRTKFEKRGDSVNANFEMIRLGDMRSLKWYSTGSVRKNGDWRENDVAYEKTMANGDKDKATGVVKYTVKDYLNYQLVFNVDNRLRFNWLGQNQNGVFLQKISHARLDYNPVEGEYKLQVEKKSENDLSMLDVVCEIQRGGDLMLKAGLKNVDLNMNGKVTTLNRDMSMDLKIKSLRVDMTAKSSRSYDLKTKTVSINGMTNYQMPYFKNPSETVQWKDTFDVSRNLNNEIKIKYQLLATGLESVGLKKVDVDFAREIQGAKVNYNLNSVLNEVKNFKVKLVADKAVNGLKLSVRQDFVKSFYSRVLKQEVTISDCDIDASYLRVTDRSSGKFALDSFFAGKCDGKLLGEYSVNIARTYPENMDSWPLFSFKSSKIAVAHKLLDVKDHRVELTLEKSDLKKSGLAEMKFEIGEKKYVNSISYDREVDETTQKLVKGSYKMFTILGDKATKTCEMKIESASNFYNTLNCKITSDSMPETSYGYAYKSEKVKEENSGEKVIQKKIIQICQCIESRNFIKSIMLIQSKL